MAKFIPPINLPNEGVAHARWLEKGLLAVQSAIEAILRRLDAIEKQLAALGRRNGDSTVVEGSGLPMPPLTGGVLRGTTNPRWTYEWQGLLPEYYVTLDSVNGSTYTTTELGGSPSSLGLLPIVKFSDGGTTMQVISLLNYADSKGGGQFPIYLSVDVMPSFDGEEFTIYPPDPLNTDGSSVPYYKLQITNPTAYTASVMVSGGHISFDQTAMHYAGTRVPVMGTVTAWTVEPSAFLAWHVEVHKGWGATATPVVINDIPGARFSDPFYDLNVAAMANMYPFTGTDGTHYNDTSAVIRLGRVRASTDAPVGADVEVDVLVGGVSVLTSPLVIPSGETTGVLVPDEAWWPAGDALTVTATGGTGLTVQVWAG